MAGERQLGRIAGFDGLRAIAVGAVIVGHLRFGNGLLGSFGVRTFFVLSGFLITSLLVAELQRTGTVNLGRFVARRAIRIFPAYYAMLAFVFLVTALPLWRMVPALLYTTNFLPPDNHVSVLGHTWSLSIEEQYYLAFPALVLVAGTVRRLRWVALAIAGLCLVAAALGVQSTFTLPAVLPIVVGALAAISRQRFAGWVSRPWWVAVSLAAIASPALIAQPTELLPALGAAGLLLWLLSHQSVGVRLDWGPLGYLGRISYGIYIWQGVFTGNGSDPEFGSFQPTNPAVMVGLTLLFAVVSWHLLERPLLRLRDRQREDVGTERQRDLLDVQPALGEPAADAGGA